MSDPGRPDPQRVAALFEALADLAPREADRRLADDCGSDVALRAAVQQVLLHDRIAAPAFLEPKPALLIEALRGGDPAQGATAGTSADEDPLAVSSRLGRYYVLHKLAEGGMGLIYAGYDDSLHRRVALKVLRRGEAVRAWLLREGQALGRLAHPNVVSIHEVGEHEGRVFLAMELIEGPTLRCWLDAAPRSFAETLPLFLQAGRGLAAAHRAGLVHRDFKPDNVLIGQDERARVVDFGIAALAHTPAEVPAELASGASALANPLTQTGVLMGTPAFMSPEQFRGERATALSDQFSFCVALYRAAYGASPHPIADLPGLAQHVQHEPPVPPPRRAEVPSWLAPLLLRGLDPDPALRFSSMDELLLAIERHLPRDPELDPTPIIRERLLLSPVFILGYVLTSGLFLSAACARVLMRPAGLIAVPAILMVLILAVLASTWRGLRQNRYGRRLASLYASLPVALLGHRLIGLRIGLSAEQILVGDMVLIAVMWSLLAQTYEGWFAWLSAVAAIGAVGAAMLPQRVPTVLGLLGLASIAIIAIRVYIDRHLTPQAVVWPSENPQAGVGSPPLFANDQ